MMKLKTHVPGEIHGMFVKASRNIFSIFWLRVEIMSRGDQGHRSGLPGVGTGS